MKITDLLIWIKVFKKNMGWGRLCGFVKIILQYYQITSPSSHKQQNTQILL